MLMTLLVSCLCVLAPSSLIVFAWRRERARGRLARLARRLHLTYTPTDSHGWGRRFRGLELFRQGHHRYVFDMVAGSTRLGPVYGFRYRYERGFGVDRRTYRWTVAALELEHSPAGVCLRHPELPESVGQAFPATLECCDRLISLQAVDDGTEAQYERLLDAVQQLAGEVLKEEGKRQEARGNRKQSAFRQASPEC